MGSCAGLYLADHTSPIPSHCASIVTSTVRVNVAICNHQFHCPTQATCVCSGQLQLYKCCSYLKKHADPLTLKVVNFWKFTSYCSSRPLWSGMGEVVSARTLPPYIPIPSHCASIVVTSTLKVNFYANGRIICSCLQSMKSMNIYGSQRKWICSSPYM